ncbi:MAG: hypothetical protein BGO11_10330 [Solirubrobacterales bacterium 70-9]|nr:MAG: hypothetical protein BGO11_10330 [Solirubrobacterales bacterium 70-9]
MTESTTKTDGKHRVLFCIGVLQPNFDAPADVLKELVAVLEREFADLRGRFGVEVLGTFDDDMIMVGPSTAFPWTSYILADVPDLEAAISICGLLREVEIGEHRLWRYLRIEARIGRALFFGNE